MKEKIKIKKKNHKKNSKTRTCFNKSFLFNKYLFRSRFGQQNSNRNTKLNNWFTNWLLILAPILTVCLVGYYFLRKSSSDEMDGKRWDSRIKVAIICCIGVIVASGLINLIVGYYK